MTSGAHFQCSNSASHCCHTSETEGRRWVRARLEVIWSGFKSNTLYRNGL